MVRKKVTLCLMAGVLLVAAAGVCFGDAAAQISQADKYVKAGNFSKAEGIYKAVLQSEGKSDSALKAQRKLITLYIHEDKNAEAQVSFDKILADYAGNPNLAEQIYWVGRGYRVADDFDKAKSIYQQVIQRDPNGTWANRARINIKNMEVWSLIKAGNFEQAKTQLEQMTKDFAGNSYLAEALFWTARKFRQANQFEDAQNIYTQIIQKYPTDAFADKASVELSNCMVQQLINTGQDDKAIVAISKLFTDMPNNPQVVSVASRIAELYQAKSRDFEKAGNTKDAHTGLARAAAILELIIAKAPVSPDLAQFYCSLGNYYYQTGNNNKSLDCFQKVVGSWPDYAECWNAQFMIGRNYEAMKQKGQIASAMADSQIKGAYEGLLAKYPDCEAAKYARKWLKK